MFDRLAQMEARYDSLSRDMSDPTLVNDQKKFQAIAKEHRDMEPIVEKYRQWHQISDGIIEAKAMLADPDMKEMAEEELAGLEPQLEPLAEALKVMLLPKDPNDDKNIVIELRAGTGGDEAALFAGDLYRMYNRYAETRGWKIEPLESSPSEMGGFKEVVFKVSGEDVFSTLKYESGVHRVQRVPATEAQGRIHTSAATVAALPEAEEVDFHLKPEEIRIEVCRSSGAGGQGVNTTDSAVQILHIPTGMIVRCQDGRSQIKNKEKGLTIMRSRLLEKKQQEEAAKYSAHRRALIGGGGREEKIRTYNYPQNRITDHRIEVTLYNLDQFMEGRINDMVEKLKASEIHDRLAEAGLE